MIEINYRLFEVKDVNFYIDGKAKFIYGGELHYFRVPKKEWLDRIIKIKEAGCNLISTYIPWVWHEKSEGEIDLDGSTTEERDLISFLNMVKEQEMFCLVRPGPYIMSEIKNHGIPFWVNEKYPEVVAKKQDGQMHESGTISYLHPTFISKVDNWYKAVCDVIRPMQISEGGPVVMFQLDNEVGMLQWVTNQADYNEETMKHFVEYLKDKYEINVLSEKLGIKSYEEAVELLKSPKEDYAVFLQNELCLFNREYFKMYIEKLKSLADKYGIKVPFVINVHGFDMVEYAKRGTRYPIGLSQLYEVSKIQGVVTAGDYYIGNIVHENYHDIVLSNSFTQCIQSKEQPLFSAEFQGGFQMGRPRLQPSTYELNTRLCIANGMNALNYYMFAGGENYEDLGLLGRRHDWQAPISSDGSLKKQYFRIKYLSKVIKAMEDELLNSHVDNVTHIGFNPDYYMTEYSNEFTKQMYETIKKHRDMFLFDGIGRGLTLNNITYSGLDLKKDSSIDPEKVRSLWTMGSFWMDEDIQNKLIQYVKDGGQLVLLGALPSMDMKGSKCTLLRDEIGVKVTGRFNDDTAVVEGIDAVFTYLETYSGEALEVLGIYKDKCCAFEKTIGKGKIVTAGIGLEIDQNYKEEIIRLIAERVKDYPVTAKNDNIDVSFKSAEDSDSIIMFIQNYDEYDKTMKYDYLGIKLFDGEEITVGGRSGLMLPINFKINDGCKLIYSTCEMVSRTDSEIEFFCRQKVERLKFDKEVKVILDECNYGIIKDNGYYEIILNNCSNKTIKIKL